MKRRRIPLGQDRFYPAASDLAAGRRALGLGEADRYKNSDCTGCRAWRK